MQFLPWNENYFCPPPFAAINCGTRKKGGELRNDKEINCSPPIKIGGEQWNDKGGFSNPAKAGFMGLSILPKGKIRLWRRFLPGLKRRMNPAFAGLEYLAGSCGVGSI